MVSIRRRKSCLTIIFLFFCLIYFNWFVNISQWNQQSNDPSSSSESFNNNENIIIYEIIEGYDYGNLVEINTTNNAINYKRKNIFLENNNFKNNKFFLLSAKNSILNYLNNKEVSNNKNVDKNQISEDPSLFLDNHELNDLIKLLYKFQAFSLDPNFIKHIKYSSSEDDSSAYSSENNEKITHISHFKQFDRLTSGHIVTLTFGIFLKSFNHLNNVHIFIKFIWLKFKR
jgi:hypothetical protein